jgi:hypothetical protein
MSCGRGLERRVAEGLLVLAMALSAAPLAAQATGPCTPPSGDTGFAEIQANVFAGTFDKVLPFDVPVRICAPVPNGTVSASVKVAVGKQKLSLGEASCVTPPPGGDPWGASYPGRVDSQTTPGTTVVRVVVPRLSAQRYYAFCFLLDRPLTPEEMQKFQPEVLAIVDRWLAGLTSADLTGAQLDQLRQGIEADLAQRLLAITGAERVESGLDELVRAVIEPQLRTRLIQQGGLADPQAPQPTALATLQEQLKTALDAVRTDGALAKLLTLLDQEAATNVVLRDLLARNYAAATALATATDAQATAMATGQDPAAPTPGATLASTRDSAAAGAAAQRYNAVDAAATDLAALIQKMTGPEAPPAVRAGLADADRAALAALIAPGGPLARAMDLSFALAGQAQRLAGSLAEREKAVADFAGQLQLALSKIFLLDGSTTGNFETASNWYISADAGLTWSSGIDEVVPYVGTNIYLRPVNKNAPLRTLGSFRQTFSRRFAFTLGLTAQSIADTRGAGTTGATRDDLFGSQSLLVGAGLRLTDMIRVGAGALVFKQNDPNPLIDSQTTGRALYFSISFDINVARAFQGGLGGVLAPGG